MKKWWVKLLLACVVIVLVPSVLFFHSGSDSKKLVEQYRNRLLAAGEKLNPDDFIPPHADSEKNGAALLEEAARSFAPRGANAISTNPPIAMNVVAPGKASIVWRESEVVFLVRSRLVTNTWDDVERDLANQGFALSKLQEAAERPQFDFIADYHQMPLPLPHLSHLREAATLLSAEVIFDLHRGDTASAVTNLETLLAIANAGKDEPMIVSQLYRLNLIQKALAVQWEWLQAANITDEQLASLQARWTNVDFIKPMEQAMLMGRSKVSVLMKEKRAGNPLGGPGGPGPTTGGCFSGIQGIIQSVRRGAGNALFRESWSYDDELNLLEGYHVLVETMRQVGNNGYFKDAFAERERKIAALGLDRTNANWLRTELGNLPEISPRTIRYSAEYQDRLLIAEALRQCAITAIALKRYELRHGTLPKDLNALAPEFLPDVPRDPVDGQPLRYRLNADGTFLLYSIGTNGVDDGGDATPIPPETSFWWGMTRDWVWPQPATPAEVQNYYDHPPK